MRFDDRIQRGLLVAAMVGVGAVAWTSLLARPLEPDISRIAALPHDLAGWTGHDLPLDQGVESMLRADFNLQRAYRHPLGDVVWLYVGYYGTARGGRPEHTPNTCYHANGWEIERSFQLDGQAVGAPRVNEYRVAQKGHRRLVHFWYRSGQRTGILGGLGLSLARFRRWLAEGRGDGALVRISTPLRDGDEDAARARLRAFAALLDRELAARWPQEERAGEAGEGR